MSAPAAATDGAPGGTADWITPDLIADTLDTWQSHFPEALTADDAVEILINTARLLDALEPDP
jgi:hypothetical protein